MDSNPYENPNSHPSSLLKDISNFKTPKRPSTTLKPQHFQSPNLEFFTASKQTPRSISTTARRTTRPSKCKSKSTAATLRRLKAFELEQSQSSRKEQIKKEQSLKVLAKSLKVWLNFLFQNPRSCGCEAVVGGGEECDSLHRNKKRESRRGIGVGVEATWRSPKRRRESGWWYVDEGVNDCSSNSRISSSGFVKLRKSLEDVCSLDDLAERMQVYFSLACCQEIFQVMTQVTKNIDDGRLKMKAHCPMVTDYGMKEKAIKTLFCYNPIWLRIGLYIILGGDSLLPTADVSSDQDVAFLKMIIDKQFLSHAGLAKAYAYNKKVEGLYRPGYYECLGNVILKRFLLLSLILDRAKSQSSLPLKYGIDGVDGGSMLLFNVESSIKSSQQMVNDFLLPDLMHGEGSLLAHLTAVGFKVSYQQATIDESCLLLQSPLIEYDFKLVNLFEDLQDGVRLCRAIQLLKRDSSILMKLAVPSNNQKKKLANCGIALQYLKESGMSLNDEDGMTIEADDIVHGDKELTLSLLWNMFVHMQLPLLVNNKILAAEVCHIHGMNLDNSVITNFALLDVLLSWIQAICERYDLKIERFDSLVDGKAIWCLLDYYFRKEMHCSYSSEDLNEMRCGESIVSADDYSDAVHNFILSQKLTGLLGDFPEVLEIGDVLEHHGACNDRSVIILLGFLSSQLIIRKSMDQLNFHKLLGCTCQSLERRYSSQGKLFLSKSASNQEQMDSVNKEEAASKFKAIQAWWQKMAEQNSMNNGRANRLTLETILCSNYENKTTKENEAIAIQSHYRGLIERRKYLRIRNAVSFLQNIIRAWLIARHQIIFGNIAIGVQEFFPGEEKQAEPLTKFLVFFYERYKFVRIKRSVLLIQQAMRNWINQKHLLRRTSSSSSETLCVVKAAINQYPLECRNDPADVNGGAYDDKAAFYVCKRASAVGLQVRAAAKIQLAWKNFVCQKDFHIKDFCATKIQSHVRKWLLRRKYVLQKEAAIKIQRGFRFHRNYILVQETKLASHAAVTIQSHVRRWIIYRSVLRYKYHIVKLQSHWRGWLRRKYYMSLKEAVVTIQTAIRSHFFSTAFQNHQIAAVEIQRFVRQQNAQKRLLGASMCHEATSSSIVESVSSFENILSSVVRVQRWWRTLLLCRSRAQSAITIQSYVRGWIARQINERQRRSTILIQSCVRGWMARRMNEKQRQNAILIQSYVRDWIDRQINERQRQNAILIQSHVRGWIARQIIERQRRSAILIQSCVRGWIVRRIYDKQRRSAILIQSYWKGYLARSDLRGQLADLRWRVQKTAANIDDSMRIINRLTAALLDLLNLKSVSSILHICATLDMATQHSQKCCEKLVEAGAIDKLLKVIRSLTQSIPDQGVLKHALSTLKNLARYPDLLEVLIDNHGSVETCLWVMIRNKEENYFIASGLLKKICTNPKGVQAVLKMTAMLKRLLALVDEPTKKVLPGNRHARGVAAKDNSERRSREAMELLKMVGVL